jgi:MOSC domain-containing protein YiiM
MMNSAGYLTMEELEASLETMLDSPGEVGRLEMIVRRPGAGQREVLSEGVLDVNLGLVGDRWVSHSRPGTRVELAHLDTQLTLMNSRVIAALAHGCERWPLAGDQLFVDLDLGAANLPAGTRLGIGQAVIEITAHPHTGCSKFAQRFGLAAMQFVNAPARKDLRLRGVNAKVIQPGVIRTGDAVRVIREPQVLSK